MRTHASLLCAVLVIGGCGGEVTEGDSTGSSSGGIVAPTTGASATDTGTTDDSAGTTTPTTGATGLKFDLEGEPPGTTGTTGGEPPLDEGCKRVDVLIAIDNSGSMQEEIAALAGPVFDSFPEALLDVGYGLDDFQLGVIDACNDPPFLHDTGAGGACNYSTSTNYMSSASPALFDEYRCATELTQSGYMGMEDECSGDNDDEQPANTAAGAVSAPAITAENAGFMRDDAVLFVVAITDEDEQPVPEQSAQEIYDKLVAAKGTIDNVVFLGIGGGSDCEGPYGSADDAQLLRGVSELFAAQQRGLFWDLCQGDLQQAFAAGLEVVDSACIAFEPPG